MFYANAQTADRNILGEETIIPCTMENLRQYLHKQGLDWKVAAVQEKHPITGEPIPFFATVRESDGRVFQTGFTKRYTPIQNLDAFQAIAEMGKHGDISIARAMSFDGGRVVAAQVDLGEMHIGGGLKNGQPDSVKKRLTFATTHDGTGALQATITPIRIVCRNTLTYAVSGKVGDFKMSIKHTQSGEARVKALASAYQVVNGAFKRTEAAFNVLADRKLTRGDFSDLMETLFPTPKDASTEDKKKIEQEKYEVASLYAQADRDSRGQSLTERDTAWNLYNAITNRNDHHSTVRAVEGPFGTPSKAEARDKSVLFGTIQEKNSKVLTTLIETLKAEDTIEKILSMVDTSPIQKPQPKSNVDQIMAMLDFTPKR